MTQEELFADSDDKSRQPNNSSFFALWEFCVQPLSNRFAGAAPAKHYGKGMPSLQIPEEPFFTSISSPFYHYFRNFALE